MGASLTPFLFSNGNQLLDSVESADVELRLRTNIQDELCRVCDALKLCNDCL